MEIAKVELATWRTSEMIAASDELISSYGRYSGLSGAENWHRAALSFRKLIKEQSQRTWEWETPWKRIVFSGFQPVEIHEDDGESSSVTIKPPQFILEDGIAYDILNARKRSQLDKNTLQVAEVVSAVHKLDLEITRSGLIVLGFTEEDYKEKSDVINGVAINTTKNHL